MSHANKILILGGKCHLKAQEKRVHVHKRSYCHPCCRLQHSVMGKNQTGFSKLWLHTVYSCYNKDTSRAPEPVEPLKKAQLKLLIWCGSYSINFNPQSTVLGAEVSFCPTNQTIKRLWGGGCFTSKSVKSDFRRKKKKKAQMKESYCTKITGLKV